MPSFENGYVVRCLRFESKPEEARSKRTEANRPPFFDPDECVPQIRYYRVLPKAPQNSLG